jgi:1-acyl-sn-glycerol-3-phosphate acyltransferase
MRPGDLDGWWRLGIAVVGAATRLLFRLRVTGAERIPRTGPAVVAANHLSALDGIVLALVVGRDGRRMTRFLTAAEFFAHPLFGRVLRRYRQIPLRRGHGDAGALDEAVRTVRSGAVAGIFPEGRVNPTPAQGMQRGRTGLGRIALSSGAPIVPVGIWGTHRRYPKEGFHLRRPWRPTLVLAFGTPIAPEGDPDSAEDVQRVTEEAMARIGERAAEARRLAEG